MKRDSVPVSLDALGIQVTLLNSIMALRRGWRHVQIGLTTKDEAGQVPLPVDLMVVQEIEFRGSFGNSNHHFEPLLQMVANGWVHPERIIGERVTLADTPRVLDSVTDFGTIGFTTITSFE